MLAIYLFFVTFQILSSVLCAYLCFKIARLNMTPTFTFYLLGAAFTMRLISQAHGLFYVADVVNFYQSYPTWLILGSNLFGALTTACFLIAFLRIYVGLKEKGIK